MMQLSQQEIDRLQDFRLAVGKNDEELTSELNDLLDEKSLYAFLQKLEKQLGAPDSKVTSSVFVKRYAFLAVMYLYAMSCWNKKLDISFDNVTLVSKMDHGHWLPDFYFHLQKAEGFSGGSREQWRENAVKELFADHLNTLLNKLLKTTKIAKLILWENIAIYIFWLYETALASEKDEEVRERAHEDFKYLIEQAPGSLFGDYHQNPLKRYYNQPEFVEHFQDFVRVRKTCCFTYQLPNNKDHCKTCPIICRYNK